MTGDQKIHQYLVDNGYPDHVVRAGRKGLVERWREFVEQVEKGYSLGLEDYRNDLDLRGILHNAGAEDETVASLDHRLKKLLVPAKARVWESASGDHFWDFGYPSNAGPDLLDDLRSEELIP